MKGKNQSQAIVAGIQQRPVTVTGFRSGPQLSHFCLPPKFSLPPSLHLPPKSSHRRPPFGGVSFFRFRQPLSHEPATVSSPVILPVPTRCFARARHRSELRHSSGSGNQFRTSPPPFRAPSFFRFRRGPPPSTSISITVVLHLRPKPTHRPSSISGRFPVPSSPQIRELLVPPYPVVRGCCRDHDWGSIKQHHHHQIRGRVFCKKGCDADGETWEECLEQCNEICYKDPVLKDRQWSAYIDCSPGASSYSEVKESVNGKKASIVEVKRAINQIISHTDP
ncbi:uncharacterized protein LOC133873197 [Alnus glutinosa]|uniref:uncharacterized protein LOC133873197 n=1 Tax=Alnus glutinosa TaxID=3517 RepID=UPI002D768C6C|nr:uncharacterized protein LOC133873197 [Alnus glutinosa]